MLDRLPTDAKFDAYIGQREAISELRVDPLKEAFERKRGRKDPSTAALITSDCHRTEDSKTFVN